MKTFYKVLSIVIGVVGFISGIVMGNVYRIQEITSRLSEGKFNYPIMFSTWLSAFLLVAVFVGIYEILDYQEAIHSNSFDIFNRVTQVKDKLESDEKTSTK